MGETAAVLGGRQPVDRQNGLAQCDELLVAGVRAGDRDAFEEIYDRYARGILAFCVQMLGSREAAEDALQQTFVSAYRSLRRGESSILLRPWLYTIARNRCLSELRARRDALGVDELVTDAPVIEGLTDQVQRREDLREMLDDMQRLPADQRAALVLFELGDHPQKDIASVLGVRTEKVKALVFQAREALVRGRAAREHPCRDIREQLSTLEGRIPARSVLRAHIERCPGCQSFEDEVRHQRAALALILPVALTGELKNWILGSALHSGGAVAAGVGACGGGGVAAGACGGGAIVGGATVVSTMGGGGAISAATAGGIAGAGAGTAAIATSAPLVAAATGLTAVGETVGGLSATGVVAKILTAAAIATVAAGSGHTDKPIPRAAAPAGAAKGHHRLLASAHPLGVRVPARDGGSATDIPPVVTGVPRSVTATPLGSPASAPSSTSATQSGATSSTAGTSTTSGSTNPPASGTAGGGSASSPLASGSASSSGGGSTTSAPPAASGAQTTQSGSSGSSGSSPASTSTAPATNPSSSPATDQSTTTTVASTAPPANSGGSGDASGSPPSTAASDVAAGAAAATGSANAAAASSGTSSSADGATAPSTSSTAATAAGPVSTSAANGLDASTGSASGN